MSNQQPGMSPQPMQHPSSSEMQLWQQHMMYKKLQELHRQQQQQQQQLEQGARQQNSLSQAVAANQLPTLLNGVPISDASNYMWSNDTGDGESKAASNPQMLIAGNMNWAQGRGASIGHGSNGIMFSNEQGQAIRSTGYSPQQVDQSLYGTPVTSSRGLLSQYPQFQGMSNEFTAVMAKAGGIQPEKTSVQSAPFHPFQNDQRVPEQSCLQDGVPVAAQGFQGKTSFVNAPVRNLSSDVVPRNFQQVNYSPHNVQTQEIQGGQEQAGWSGNNVKEKAAAQAGPSRGTTSLDPTEEKILFGTDDDGNWDALFGSSSNTRTGGYLHGSSLESNDCFSAFPSLQSGSWSALMQEAVQASSSEKGCQEEWSGLSFPKTEPSIRNHSATPNDMGKHQAALNNHHHLQSSASITSRPFPLFNDAGSSPACRTAPSIQQGTTYDQNDRAHIDASPDSFQQSSKEVQDKHFDQSYKQKQIFEGGLQSQVQSNAGPNAVWAGNMFEKSVKNTDTSDMQFNAQFNQAIWPRQVQPGISSKGWNGFLSGGNTSEVHDNDNRKLDAQTNDTNRTIDMERDYDGNALKVGRNYVNSAGGMEPLNDSSQMSTDRRQVDRGKHVAFGSFVNSRGGENVGTYQHQPSRRPEAWDSSMNSMDKGSGDAYMHIQEQSRVASRNSQHANAGGAARENSLLIGKDSSPPNGDSHKNSGLSGWRTVGSHRFPFHPMGNMGMNVEPAVSPHQSSYSQGQSQSVIQQSKHQEQGYSGRLQFADHGVANIGKGKGNSTDLQRSVKGSEEIHHGGLLNSHVSPVFSSFDGSTPEFSQHRKVGQTSQNMLELLHKVDQTRDSSAASSFASECNTPHQIPEAVTSDGSASHLEHHQSSGFQGFGLRLAPPSQRSLVSNHVLYPQTSPMNFTTRQLEPGAVDEDQTQLTSTTSVHSRHPAHETPSRENWDSELNLSAQTCKVTAHSITKDRSPAPPSPDLSYMGNQLQLQRQQQLLQQRQASGTTGHKEMDQSVNQSFGREADGDEHVKHGSLLRQAPGFHDGTVADQSAQLPLPTIAGRNLPSRLSSPMDTRQPVSQFNSPDTVHSQPMNAAFHHFNSSSRQPPVVDTGSILQASATSGTSQQAGFSTMLRNVWTNASVQQRLSGVQLQRLIPKVPQSIILSTSQRDATSRAGQDEDDQGTKRQSVLSETGTCSVNRQQSAYGEENLTKNNSARQIPFEGSDITSKMGSASEGQEQVPEHQSDGYSSAPLSPLVHLHQHDVGERRHGQESFLKSHVERVSVPNVTPSTDDAGIHGRMMTPSDGQQPNYSLLQQMQAMKNADSDMSRRAGKRLKGDFGSDASQMEWKASQNYVYGQNNIFRVPAEGELGAMSHSSFPPDGKMLSFSLRENEEKSSGTNSQLVGRDMSSQDLHPLGQHDYQNQILPPSISSTSNFMGRNEHCQISPQMARTWFEQYRKYKNGQILAMYNEQRSAKAAASQYFPAGVSERMDNNTLVDQRIETSPFGSLEQGTSPSNRATSESSQLPSDVAEHDMVLRPRKRKNITSDLPWHKVVTVGSRRLQTIRMAEHDWAQAVNRIIEKVEDEAEMIEDSPSVPRARRRLILTTQLMQQLLSSVPASFLATEVTSSYESVTYFLAKSVLGDACSLISLSGSESHPHLEYDKRTNEKLKASEMTGDIFLSKVVEDFDGRLKKLEIDLSRLDKRTSILDVRLECQELERFALINRLGKYHGRSQADGVESSSISQNASRRIFPQRYVSVLSMPGNLPEGVTCLSL